MDAINDLCLNRISPRTRRVLCARRHDTHLPPYWAGTGDGNYPGNSTSACIRSTPLAPLPTPWRSPADQPAWARPALLALAAVAAVAYGWGMACPASSRSTARRPAACRKAGTTSSSGVRSSRTVTVTSCLARSGCRPCRCGSSAFTSGAGPAAGGRGRAHHPGAVPGVRRLAEPAADLIAAAVFAVTPITVLLSRGNVSDSLLILLLVLAADATSAALLTGSLGSCCSPPLGRPGVPGEDDPGLAGPARAGRRLPARRARGETAYPVRARRAGRAGHRRGLPLLDDRGLAGPVPSPALRGRQSDDSVYTQVFDYNGLAGSRNWANIAGPPSPLLVSAIASGRLLTAKTMRIKPSWHRLLACLFAADSRWLLPALSPRAGRAHLPAPPAGATRCAPPSCCVAAVGCSSRSSSAPAPT